ncbi:hypothetical protein E4633_17075 [Geomonas terrae]|uniref:Uncharacterized protein n=1 Tax=Geomonas terrae TaxID=2562681 RepID=A0A4S1CBK6_9BACT|nr:ankyrin repeat domain-containing protein [Geomonas terrae]TGU70711.1 hypothetical protein E4633_17075 [Geomonas terrae]
MSNQDLTARYFIAETAVWLLGAILLISRFFGLAASQPLPLLNVTLEKHQDFFRVVAILLFAATFYLLLEWKLSSQEARRPYVTQMRVVATTLFSCISLWFSYDVIFAKTVFAGTSPAWFLGFAIIGSLLGGIVSTLVLASLMIRTPTEAKAIKLPRVPVATRAQYMGLIPLASLLLIAYYVLCYTSPDGVNGVGLFLVVVPFSSIIIVDFASLCLKQDEDGERLPYAKRIASLKRAFDSHDYSYFLNNHASELAEKHGIPTTAPPEAIQSAMQKEFSVEFPSASMRFHAQTLEEFQLELYSKDGNDENLALENHGVRIHKHQGKKGNLRVLVIPDEQGEEPTQIEVPTALVEAHAEKYQLIHPMDAEVPFQKVMSYAINQAVIQTMCKEQPSLLARAAMSGEEDLVKELLSQNVDVNEQAAIGWTALLSAAAQGYPKIVESLLVAGANPDLCNLAGNTPLLYGARYNNIEVCRLLLEYGANPDIQDKGGMTALMKATRFGFQDIAELLLKEGASTDIKECNGKTALDFAHKFKQGKIAKMIRQAAKQRNKP